MVPFKSQYCMDCGAHLREETQDMIDQEDEFDLENRDLCPDGTCTGIIIDGKCSECGVSYKENKA